MRYIQHVTWMLGMGLRQSMSTHPCLTAPPGSPQSEVKEERSAQPGAGDMSGVGCPVGLWRSDKSRVARHNLPLPASHCTTLSNCCEVWGCDSRPSTT